MDSRLECILVVGSLRSGAIERAYSRALKRQGLDYVEQFDLEQPVKVLAQRRIVNRLTSKIQDELVGSALYHHLKASPADFSAVLVFKGRQLTPKWLAQCRETKPRATWVNINPDDPFNLDSNGSSSHNILNTIPQYDIYTTWGRHLVTRIQTAGCQNVIYLPFAYDTDCHFPSEAVDRELAETITFVGTWDKQREEILTHVADLSLRVYGNFWDRLGKRSPLRGKVYPSNLYGAELRRVITSSKASLNILRPQNYCAHNMRTFEIPAMRGLMVTTQSDGQNEFFPNAQACLMFKDMEGLRETLQRILDNSFDVESMKETAFNLRHGQSYDERARDLCDAITRYRRTGRVG